MTDHAHANDAPPQDLAKKAGELAGSAADPVTAPNEADLDLFWQIARKYVGRSRLDVIVGPLELKGARPAAFSFTVNRHTANELALLVLRGEKTATASLLAEYQEGGEPLPEPGDLSILCDGVGEPVALLATTTVKVEQFDHVSAEHAKAEGEGDRSLGYWRATHRAFWSATCNRWRGDGSDQVVLENFEVVYQIEF